MLHKHVEKKNDDRYVLPVSEPYQQPGHLAPARQIACGLWPHKSLG